MKITIHFDGYEYRVPSPKRDELAAYYTDHRQDALDTFKVIWKGTNAVANIRRVAELPNTSLPFSFNH